MFEGPTGRPYNLFAWNEQKLAKLESDTGANLVSQCAANLEVFHFLWPRSAAAREECGRYSLLHPRYDLRRACVSVEELTGSASRVQDAAK